MELRARTLLAQLAQLRERRVETFGSSGHRFELAPPLPEADVKALEAKLGALLPESYRWFLTQVAASGAGPYYGITPPACWGDALLGDVSMPDYATRACAWTPDSPRDEGAWRRIAGALDEPFQGAIAIGTQGCAYYTMLVVTGEARGRVMYVNFDGGVPFFPENPDFLSWYERWLDELSWGYEHFWFGTAMPGDEKTLRVAASSGPRKGAALSALFQVPALAEETIEVVIAQVEDDDPKVRAMALRLMEKRDLGARAEARVRAALSDADPDVRRAALAVSVKSGAAWHDAAKRALADDDDEVVMDACRALEKDGRLDEEDVVRLLGSPSPRVVRTATRAAATVPTRRLFDMLLPRVERGNADDDKDTAVALDRESAIAVLAHARAGVLDAPRLAALRDVFLALLARAEGPSPPSQVITGLRQLAQADDVSAFDALVALTRHPEPFYRFEAAHALGELGRAEALPALEAMLDDEAMPRAPNRSTAWSVGANADRAIAKIRAKPKKDQ